VNRPTTIVNVNNINQQSAYYTNNTNIQNFGGYRPWVGDAIYGWNSAWYGNYNTWHRAYYPWYNGCWSGNIFDAWGVGPVTWGLSMWGLNSLVYSFGYATYVNPFYVVPAPTVVVPEYVDYSRPIVNVVQALPDSGQEPPPIPETAAQAFDVAQASFKKGDYATALTKTEAALKDFPNDPVFHEFRALVLFARGQYRQASAAIHALLASGPGWDWTTMSSLYPDTVTYGNQLAALEKAGAAKPDDPSLQFLLAYHYLTVGDAEAAKGALTRAKKLLPADPIITQLAEAAGVEGVRADPKAPAPATDVKLDIAGAWTATRADGGKIGLSMTKEGAFAWSVEDKGGKKESFDGTFSLENDLLILERKSGGALMGRITALAENKFLFRLLGGSATDPGLTFMK
jgi:tetratricopeptide (TPR) repeat protein